MKKVILISGGTDGLGKTIAQRLAGSHHIFILSPHEDKLAKIAKDLSCDYCVCDISSYSKCTGAIETILTRVNTIDCLINNAGIWTEGELDDTSAESIKRLIDVNTLGTMYLTKAVIPQMKKSKHGLLMNIVSQIGVSAKANRSVYAASKWAITGFTKSLQLELAKYGIGVTGIYPGKLKTNMFTKVGIKKSMADGLDTDEVAKLIEFIVNSNDQTLLTDIGIKNLSYE